MNQRHFGGKMKLTGFSASVALVTVTSHQMLEIAPFNINNRACKRCFSWKKKITMKPSGVSTLACVTSVSSRGSSRKLGQEQKKK